MQIRYQNALKVHTAEFYANSLYSSESQRGKKFTFSAIKILESQHATFPYI